MKKLFIVLCLSMLTLPIFADSGLGESHTDCAAMASAAVDIDGANLESADDASAAAGDTTVR